MAHHINVCEFGTVHSQCRCISRDKATVRITCPTPERCRAKNGGYTPKHRADVG